MHKIFTVIVTFNGSQWIRQCLESLQSSTIKGEIIVVDNGSADDTLEILQTFKEQIHLIAEGKNMGFGGGNNLGIVEALKSGAEYIFLLNQDAYVRPDTIEKLYSAALKYPEYGIISPMQMEACGKKPDVLFEKYYDSNSSNDRHDIFEVRFVNAAAWFCRAEVFKKSGLFHPVFFHYGEDNHFCSRVQYHGFKVGIFKATSVIHDREYSSKDKKKILLQKMRTVPLYTLMDIRKPFFIAWLIGYRKLKRLKAALESEGITGKEIEDLFNQQVEWFTGKLTEVKAIRKATRKAYPPLLF